MFETIYLILLLKLNKFFWVFIQFINMYMVIIYIYKQINNTTILLYIFFVYNVLNNYDVI